MRRIITNIEELKTTEKVLRQSKQYVPIVTSSVINEYKSNLKYAIINSTDRRSTCQAVLDNNIVIQNSFDGTQSFKIKYNLGEFILGNFRLIHRGYNASDFSKNTEFFVTSLEQYSKFYEFLDKSVFSDEIIDRILAIVSKVKCRETTIEFTDRRAISVLNNIIVSLKEGNYFTTKNGIVKQGRKVKGIAALFTIENEVTKMLFEEFPEEFI